MQLQHPQPLAEVSTPDSKHLATLQAQLALHGIDLHPVPCLAEQPPMFTVNVHGAVRTLDSLLQVQAYARCLGIPTC